MREKGRIFGSSGLKSNAQVLIFKDQTRKSLKLDLLIMIRTFLESGFMSTIQNESMDLQNESMFLRISYTIPASLVF